MTVCSIMMMMTFNVSAKGQVFVWGFGILGKGPKLEKTFLPSMIPEILFGKHDFNPDSKVVDIKCGMHCFAAITSKLG